jgi:prepilin-type N-terminal cleavage/methylation domain-containing protein
MDKKRVQHGFALIELLFTMGLLSLVMGVAFGVYWMMQNQWERATTSSDMMGEYNVVLSGLNTVIRSAKSPNYSTKAVNVVDDQNLDIYSFDEDTGVYTRTRYRYNSGQFERGTVSTSDKFASSNPLFATIDNWETVLSDIEDIPIFADITGTDGDRRVTQIHLQTENMDNLVTVTSRYRAAPMTAAAIAAVEVQISNITVSPSTAKISVGSTVTLYAAVTPANATNKNVTWTSDNTAVASVSSGGLVTGMAGGSAVITATAVDGGIYAVCSVTVISPVTGVSLNKTATTIEEGNAETLVATVSPSNATNKTVTWSSSDKSIATVNSSGVVTAIKAGTAIITATSNDNTTVSASCTVKVPGITGLTSVTLNPGTKTISINQSFTLTAILVPTDATYKSISWKSSNTRVATVENNGKVTTTVNTKNKRGSATITVTVTNMDNSKKTAACYVNVN